MLQLHSPVLAVRHATLLDNLLGSGGHASAAAEPGSGVRPGSDRPAYPPALRVRIGMTVQAPEIPVGPR